VEALAKKIGARVAPSTLQPESLIFRYANDILSIKYCRPSRFTRTRLGRSVDKKDAMMKNGFFAAALTAFLLTACAGIPVPKTIAVDRAYVKSIKKVYVVADIPRSVFGELLYLKGETTLVSRSDPERKAKLAQTFADAVVKGFKKAGIEAKCIVPSSPMDDRDALIDQGAAFEPDALLDVECTSVQVYNNIPYATYVTTLTDFKTRKDIWRGQFSIGGMLFIYADDAGRNIFTAIIKGLNANKMYFFGTAPED
jgi:hypothetical protein